MSDHDRKSSGLVVDDGARYLGSLTLEERMPKFRHNGLPPRPAEDFTPSEKAAARELCKPRAR